MEGLLLPRRRRWRSDRRLSSPLKWTASLLLVPIVYGQVCDNQQDFSEDRFAVLDLESGVPANSTLCPQYWVWYRIRTRPSTTWSSLQQAGSIWSQQPVTEVQTHGLSLLVDAGYDEINFRFTTLSMLIVNGTPPSDFYRINPYDADAYSTVYHVYEPYTDRETVAFGYNETLVRARAAPDMLPRRSQGQAQRRTRVLGAHTGHVVGPCVQCANPFAVRHRG